MKNLHEFITEAIEQVSHLDQLFREGYMLEVKQTENSKEIANPRSEKIFPHDTRVFKTAYNKLQRVLPVSEKDVWNNYQKYVKQSHSFDNSSGFAWQGDGTLVKSDLKKYIKMEIDEECRFILMYLYYAFYKLESTNYWQLSQKSRKVKIWNDLLEDINNEIGCDFLFRWNTSVEPEKLIQFSFSRSKLGLSREDEDKVVVVELLAE